METWSRSQSQLGLLVHWFSAPLSVQDVPANAGKWWEGKRLNLRLAVLPHQDVPQFTGLKPMQEAFPSKFKSLCHGLFFIKLFIVQSSFMESGIICLPKLILQSNC